MSTEILLKGNLNFGFDRKMFAQVYTKFGYQNNDKSQKNDFYLYFSISAQVSYSALSAEDSTPWLHVEVCSTTW